MTRQRDVASQTRGDTIRMLAAAIVGATFLVGLGVPASVRATAFTVTNTDDSGPGSLRAAIIAANGTPAADVISFAIPGSGVHTIAPLTALPDITAPVTINGYSQSGASANTLAVGNNAVLRIVLSGASAPLGTDGLRLDTDDSVIRGLVINGWQPAAGIASAGVHVFTGSADNVIRGNFIGTNAAGTAAVGNSQGVRIADAPSNHVGGSTPAARNTISGNTSGGVSIGGDEAIGNQVLGNYIGTDAAGLAAVANGNGLAINRGADDNVVGGTTAAARNVISGNSFVGVDIAAPILQGGDATDRNRVQGNYIGLDALGDAAIPNDIGVLMGADGPQNDNVIGGLAPGSGNTISGNLSYGIHGQSVNGANWIQGNLIGTTPSGEAALGNGSHGISFADASSPTTIGGTTESARNVISGNGGHGIRLGGSQFILIAGNHIGTDISGAVPLPNDGHGVSIDGFSAGHVVGGTDAGEGNLIAHNALDGIAVADADGGTPILNQFSGNSVHSNGGLGIDLGDDGVTPNDTEDTDNGPNSLQNFPVLASAVLLSDGTTRIRVQLDVRPDDTYTIEFFSNAEADPSGFGEGRTYLGSADIEVGASGTANELVTLPVALPIGTPVTATVATSIDLPATSEFSEAIEVVPALRIDDVSQDEGNSGTTDFTFTASLAAAAEETLSVDYATGDGTAMAPSDYTATSGTLTFLQGQTSQTVTVAVNGDTDVEPDERFFVDLSAFSLGADAIEDGRGRGTITDDDETAGEPPVLSIDDVTGSEGDSGTTDFVFTVSRTGDTSAASSVRYRTRDGTTDGAQDYQPISGATLSFAAGQASRRITVKVVGDGKRAPDETFFVVLSDPVNASIGDARGKGTILADDPYLRIDNVTVDEPASGGVTARFRVVLSYPTVSAVTVHYRTRDGTARQGSDYTGFVDRTLSIPAGGSIGWATVRVLANAPDEPDETFFVKLFRATGPDGALRITDATGKGTIRD